MLRWMNGDRHTHTQKKEIVTIIEDGGSTNRGYDEREIRNASVMCNQDQAIHS